MAIGSERRMKRNIIIGLALLLTVAVLYDRTDQFIAPSPADPKHDAHELQDAFDNKLSNTQVRGSGLVKKLLKDDTKGSRHQRFILRLEDGQTILVAHNIDLAPRIENLQNGDRVEFYGEYEWNGKGGVVHWTHRDPGGKHIDGWLEHEGRVYR